MVRHSPRQEGDIASAIDALTPAEVDKVIIQADFTVLAPGPLPVEMQRELELMAAVESSGLASVYRIDSESIRRALDAGRSPEELRSWLHEHALGEVPQGVGFLIEDTARQHGQLRGGLALSYLRCEDPSALDLVFSSNPAGLRRLAPTVAISHEPLAAVLENLKAQGIHACAEDEHGLSIDITPQPPELPAEKISLSHSREVEPAQITAALKILRGAQDEPSETVAGSEALSVLQSAARGGRTVRLGVVNKNGQAMHFNVKPLTVSGGQVDALDPSTGKVQRFPLHRITQVFLDS